MLCKSVILIAVSALSVLCLNSCSLTPTLSPASEKLAATSYDQVRGAIIQSIELKYSRSSLTQVSFEQFALDDRVLYFECGEIFRNRASPREQQFFNLDTDQHYQVAKLARKILGLVKKGDYLLPDAGKNLDLADPGIFSITIRAKDIPTTTIKTSFDTVSNGGAPINRTLLKLTRYLRSLPKSAPCGNKIFFGIPPLNEVIAPNSPQSPTP